MTVTDPAPPAPPSAPEQPGGSAPPGRAGTRIAAHALTILGVLALSLLAQLVLIGGLQHNRDQDRNFAEFRDRLANATAPVASLDSDGRLLPSGTPVAVLSIPQLGVEEVVGEGTSPGALKSGPGHLRDTVLPGQVGVSVVLARRAAYGGPFQRIGELKRGDPITVTTGQGMHQFRVIGVRHANDPQVAAPGKTDGRLTLVTADGPPYLPSDVLRVDAQLITPAVEASGRLPAYALPDSEQLMAGDEGALIPVVGWALVMLLSAGGVVYTHQRLGMWPAWVIGVPVLGALGLAVADSIASLLPNLL
ncbi:LPXTG-site transpeptidase (sortase) family protein [Amycolatopsis sulphurea]|uniref:LPXTG-site transpeptidase (Sortase) family protein n=1 Tax=Amycolatopsis sulphurea TaxID=76022 RepID=A0A2A9F9B7_9PSEU|nr:sortase [Amycolatopsis sulphurea]PFG47009.1 LPXTG-site transpeptidase (sortase) family protein [Amycolatopsis sulphurea]